MINQQMPNLSSAGALTDTLDFVKNLWGSMSVPGMNVPGMVVPTLSVEELDKKIEDLKAVESWLNVNMSMLRGTIQTLEVQRGTIATLKSMSAAMSSAMAPAENSGKDHAAINPYMAAFAPHVAPKKSEPAEAQAAAVPPAAAESAGPPAQAEAEKKPAVPDAANAQMMNPTAWWGVLQEQFKQAVTTAMATEKALEKGLASAVEKATANTAAGVKPATKPIAPASKKTVKSPASKAAVKAKAPAAKRKPVV